jgi:hypothetical protein
MLYTHGRFDVPADLSGGYRGLTFGDTVDDINDDTLPDVYAGRDSDDHLLKCR